MTEVENFRDGPFAVKLNAVGVYGAEKVDVPTIGKNVVESKPNSAGRPSMKQNGLILGLALTVLRPIASLVFSEEGRRRRQARRMLIKRGCKSDWAARAYGQRVVKRMRGLGAGAARLEGVREFAKDAAAYALSFPLRLAFRAVPGRSVFGHRAPDPSAAGSHRNGRVALSRPGRRRGPDTPSARDNQHN